MSEQHTQFSIDGVPYQLASDCPQALWPSLCDRVFRHLARIGKEAAQSMYGEATVTGKTKMNKQLLSFKLTINPQGIVL